MIEIFGLMFFGSHLEDTTAHESSVTSPSDFTASNEEKSTWFRMYQRDRYARDRVMKSSRLLLPFLKSGDTVLDVGCFTQEARKYYPRDVKYVGIDQSRYHATTQVIDLNHGFQPIPCSHALCLETLEHLLDPEDTLHAIHESLSESGLLVVSLPNEATLFHRLRALTGIVDGECFSSKGKHLHLPSKKQAESFLRKHFEILETRFYISPSGCGSRQEWIGRILKLIPDAVHQILADSMPSLFARGFIFLCKKKGSPDPTPVDPNYRSTFVRPEKLQV